MATNYVTEIPSSLKQLARLVVRGFYTNEDALIIDMLVRNPCMKEDDIAELLRFEKKQMRARITTLRNDKYIQLRLKMETGPDGKAQKVNYYFINYKSFVNMVKYKLDLMRKRMETEERDATSRASFKCLSCAKTFTDLEADQLFDFNIQEFRCTYCYSAVEEDTSALPKKDSRLMLARFNEQLQPIYNLLRVADCITLSPEILEPEPVSLDTIRGLGKPMINRPDGQMWSGEATRNQGFAVEEARIDVTIGTEEIQEEVERKERPIWLTESTIIEEPHDTTDAILREAAISSTQSAVTPVPNNRSKKENEDILSVLLTHEKQPDHGDVLAKGLKLVNPNENSSDSDVNANDIESTQPKDAQFNVEFINSESDDDEDVPIVHVAGRLVPISEVNDDLISQMTPQEKEHYIHVYQHHYSGIFE